MVIHRGEEQKQLSHNCVNFTLTKTLQPPTVSPLQVISLIDYRPP